MRNSWNQTVAQLQAAGPTVTNTLALSSVLNPQAKFTMPAGILQYIGDKWRIVAHGIISTAGSAPGTFSWSVLFGTIAVYVGGASPTLAISQANSPWAVEIDLNVRSVGTLATVEGSGKFSGAAVAGTQVLACPGALTGFDSTTSFQVDLQGAWSVASASNLLTCQDYELISLT